MRSSIVFFGKFPSRGKLLRAMKMADVTGYAWEEILVSSGGIEDLPSRFSHRPLFLVGNHESALSFLEEEWVKEGEFDGIQVFKRDCNSVFLLENIPDSIFNPENLPQNLLGNSYGKTYFLFPQVDPPALESLKNISGNFQVFQIESHTLLHFVFDGNQESSKVYFQDVSFQIQNFLKIKSDLFFFGERFLWQELGEELLLKKKKVSVAESLTGGLISQLLTETPGASNYFHQGLVTYRTEAKANTLGVGREILERGVFSDDVALAMAERARELSGADFGVGITGLAGPGGGTKEVPVGTVFICVAGENRVMVKKFLFEGSREEVRFQSACWAMLLLRSLLEEPAP
ncbi:MAG: CinA family protein [Caldiserica bacterium]|jgi:PncC family amidohydrolase|nr:CinA family protein [Caldisericota bacterium]MDH7562338.1 CinA family protein [Caldisericota bacterium]